MGTRGAYGFRVNGKDFINYNSMSSYPSWLGVETLKYIRDNSIADLKDTASKLTLVDDNSPISFRDIELVCNFSNTDLSSIDFKNLTWDNLYSSVVTGWDTLYDLPYVFDNSNFLFDSTFCEWAYIINLDTEKLEIYEGLYRHNQRNAKGRYVTLPDDLQEEYREHWGRYETEYDTEEKVYLGVKLIKEYSLKYLQSKKGLEVIKRFEKLCYHFKQSRAITIMKRHESISNVLNTEHIDGYLKALKVIDESLSMLTSFTTVQLAYSNAISSNNPNFLYGNAKRLAEENIQNITEAWEFICQLNSC